MNFSDKRTHNVKQTVTVFRYFSGRIILPFLYTVSSRILDLTCRISRRKPDTENRRITDKIEEMIDNHSFYRTLKNSFQICNLQKCYCKPSTKFLTYSVIILPVFGASRQSTKNCLDFIERGWYQPLKFLLWCATSAGSSTLVAAASTGPPCPTAKLQLLNVRQLATVGVVRGKALQGIQDRAVSGAP
jgi:hypothetical protein